MLILALVLLQAVKSSLSYDIEFETKFKISPDLLDILQIKNDDAIKFRSIGMQGEGKLPKDLDDALGIKRTRRSLDSNVNTKQKDKYLEHLKELGASTLKHIGHVIKHVMKYHKDISSSLKLVTIDYKERLQNYFVYQNTAIVGDEKVIYLDLIENAISLIYKGEKNLLNEILTDTEYEKNQNITNPFQNVIRREVMMIDLNKKLLKVAANAKMYEIKYICNTYGICKQYPGFSDYCVHLISEIQKLSQNKFQIVINQVAKSLKKNSKHLIGLAENDDYNKISKELYTRHKNVGKMKNMLAVMRAFITDRYIAIPEIQDNIKIRTEAVRIILEIFDKAFQDEPLKEDFDKIKNDVTRIHKRSKDTELAIDKFVTKIIKTLDAKLTKQAKNEVKVLTEVYMRGKTLQKDIYAYLSKNGSNYVNDEAPKP